MVYIKVCLYGFLFFLFLVFFGVPSLEKYQRQETISISTRKLTKGIEAPPVTILAFNNNTGYGWKSKTNATGFSDRRFRFSLLDHCNEINQTDLKACISNDTFQLTEVLKTARFGMMKGSSLNLKDSSWTGDIAATDNGRYFTWDPQTIISPNLTDFVFMSVSKSFKFFILVHDKNFFIMNSNPLGPPASKYEFDGSTMQSHYQELVLIEHQRLNLDHQPCEEEKDYSFSACVKESLAEKVGCRRPWDKWNRQTQSFCTTRKQFARYDELFTTYSVIEVDQIERLTGCLKPCHYKEYKLLNSNPKDLILVKVPEDQIAIGIWAVSQHTQFEEEVLL